MLSASLNKFNFSFFLDYRHTLCFFLLSFKDAFKLTNGEVSFFWPPSEAEAVIFEGWGSMTSFRLLATKHSQLGTEDTFTSLPGKQNARHFLENKMHITSWKTKCTSLPGKQNARHFLENKMHVTSWKTKCTSLPGKQNECTIQRSIVDKKIYALLPAPLNIILR